MFKTLVGTRYGAKQLLFNREAMKAWTHTNPQKSLPSKKYYAKHSNLLKNTSE